MIIIESKLDLKNILKNSNKEKKRIGLVPTMGSLHEGHLSLIRTGLKSCDQLWVSIFINPTQFNDLKDFESYPKDIENDIIKVKSISNKINLFIPEKVQEIYTSNINSDEFEFGIIDKVMEGEYRPGHFKGVGTIVKKLFNIFNPDIVFFGEKDYQQTLIVKKLIADSSLNINLIVSPTIRNKNGLALSSRNNLIPERLYKNCGIIFECLMFSKKNFKKIHYPDLIKMINEKVEVLNHFELEYFEIRDEETLKLYSKFEKKIKYRGFICVKVEGVRLIDNLLLN